jgi:hypothetical protein
MKAKYAFAIITILLLVACKKDIPNHRINTREEAQSNTVQNLEQKQKDFNILKYVNSTERLRVRNLPSINVEKIGLLDYLTEVNIIKEDENYEIIDGIKDKWVYINTPLEGWVFNGYLIDINNLRKLNIGDWIDIWKVYSLHEIRQLIIGAWIDIWGVHSFYENGKYKITQLEGSYTGSGYWEIEDKNLVIIIDYESQDYGEWSANKKTIYQININNDILILNNQELRVKERKLMKCDSDNIWESYELYTNRFGWTQPWVYGLE